MASALEKDSAAGSALQQAARELCGVVNAFEPRVNQNFSKEVPSPAEIAAVKTKLLATLSLCPKSSPPGAGNADRPRAFDPMQLPSMIHLAALESADSKALQYVAPLVGRLEGLLRDSRLAPIICPPKMPTLLEWLQTFLGKNDKDEDAIVIVDLALVPSDVTHLIIAVIARVIFEATQRFHKLGHEALPIVLVLEEAHNFVQEGRDDPSQSPTPVQMCRRVFERIAREGRKFGMGMVLASQRPSEISPTVLSQCNTFMLHRIVNDSDQHLVRRLIPDSIGGLLRELPTLPSRHAFLLGHASPIPRLVVVNELPVSWRPRSHDPRLWDVWRGAAGRDVEWNSIASEWQGA